MVDNRKVRVGCSFTMDRIKKLEPDYHRRKIFLHYLNSYAFSLEHLHKAFIDCNALDEWTCSQCGIIVFNKHLSQDGDVMCKECIKDSTWSKN
tara:strand:- start:2565 stop:2843 length:279 start_codon:yes stop_codon:yes gene_type:complete